MTYIAGNPTPALTRELLQKTCVEAEVLRPAGETAFPVIVRSGKNEQGRKIHFLLNYSGKPVECVYNFGQGRDLLSGKKIGSGDKVEIPAWDLYIVEE